MWRILIVSVSVILMVSGGQDDQTFCASKMTCTDCIRTKQCEWCSREIWEGRRCRARPEVGRSGNEWCTRSQIVNKGTKYAIVLSQTHNFDNDDFYDFTVVPQKVQLRLRLGDEYRFSMKYTMDQTKPVDIYYLVDSSKTMESHHSYLFEFTNDLIREMRSVTNGSRLGFGSFVEKENDIGRYNLTGLCDSVGTNSSGKNPQCVRPYGYKHELRLTDDFQLFKNHVRGALTSGTTDESPIPKLEGGFDALMQTMVCSKEIGWRENARRLVVFFTDSLPHIAGDGRLAGIIEPNDERCHLDEDYSYTHGLLQDYPSISQINKKAWENGIKIIFAVNGSQADLFKNLSSVINGSSVGLLGNDPKNIVDLVREEYNKIVSTVTLKHNGTSVIDVQSFSRCLNKTGDLMKTSTCGDLSENNRSVDFDIVIKALSCSNDAKEWRQTLEIKPVGIDANLIVNLSVICECPCNQEGHPDNIPSSEYCHRNGARACGLCSCDKGFIGNRCECGGDDKTRNDSQSCRPNDTMRICSDRGTCKCGVCECESPEGSEMMFTGKYCECDNVTCKRSGGKICGGRGSCDCGKCVCSPGWSGDACGCENVTASCRPPGENTEVCSGHGECECGQCQCHSNKDAQYFGTFCEECPKCPGRCAEIEDCVECIAYGTGRLANDCSGCTIDLTRVRRIERKPDTDEESGVRLCHVVGENHCSFTFTYVYENARPGHNGVGIIKVIVPNDPDCEKPKDVLGIAVGVIVTTLILGLLILVIWKIVTIIHDKREFAKFDEERGKAKWGRGDNPLYRKATSTFENPTYGGGN